MSHDKKPIHILFASRLVIEKGVDILIDLIDKIEYSPLAGYISWTICGDGLYEKEIVELTKKYPNVEYLGRLGLIELRKQYEMADFLYMPSRFLETFGLTALESLMCGTPIVGIKKGGLIPFITDDLAVDEAHSVESSFEIFESIINGKITSEIIDVSGYTLSIWKSRIQEIFHGTKKLLIVHDYDDLIGGAEYYIAFLQKILPEIGIEVRCASYLGKTTPWKRRLMFIFSLIAFWRGRKISQLLHEYQPDTIWMHTVLRYHGPWTIYQIQRYCDKRKANTFLSHHDVGLIAPFPQHIYSEQDIPFDATLLSFLPRRLSYIHIFSVACKWMYVQIIKYSFPENMKHIIFSAFLEKHISHHFHGETVIILPHTVMEL